MKCKKLASLALSTLLAASMLAGCGSTDTGSSTSGGGTTAKTESKSDATTTTTSDGGAIAAAEVSHDSEYTVDFYNVAANFQGVQSG